MPPEVVGWLTSCRLSLLEHWVWVRTPGVVRPGCPLTLLVEGCWWEPGYPPTRYTRWTLPGSVDPEVAQQWVGWQLEWFGLATRVVVADHHSGDPYTFTAPEPDPGPGQLTLWAPNGQGVSFTPYRMRAVASSPPAVMAEHHWWPGLGEGFASYLRLGRQPPIPASLYEHAERGLAHLRLLSPPESAQVQRRRLARQRLVDAARALHMPPDGVTYGDLAAQLMIGTRRVGQLFQVAEWGIEEFRHWLRLHP
jgi:hypothetical protein